MLGGAGGCQLCGGSNSANTKVRPLMRPHPATLRAQTPQGAGRRNSAAHNTTQAEPGMDIGSCLASTEKEKEKGEKPYEVTKSPMGFSTCRGLCPSQQSWSRLSAVRMAASGKPTSVGSLSGFK